MVKYSNNGLVKSYGEIGVRKCFKFLQALAFIPRKNVVYAFTQIKSLSPSKFNCMLNYFENNYIRKMKKNSNTVRLVPLYPIQVWNMHDRVINGLTRTNNSLGSWHKHQTVFKVV